MKLDLKENIIVALITIVICTISFWSSYNGAPEYGVTLFCSTPLWIGFYVGKKPNWFRYHLYVSVVVSLVVFLIMLVASGLEWTFCIVLSFPITLISVFVGIWLGYLLRRWILPPGRDKDIRLTIYPLLILLFSGIIEHYFITKYDYGKVESTILLPYPKEKVFDFIKSVDTLDTEKPFLMKLGLAVPQKCVLEYDGPGAKRTCYFEGGTIEEKVLETKRGEILKMEVTKSELAGLKWLKFLEAIYVFKEKDGKTELTRITTYRTSLRPRFYWSFWEKQSIEAEHEYVLHDLEQRLAKDSNSQVNNQ